jgi:hypothetical protein
MKKQLDLEKAAAGETFGALAVGHISRGRSTLKGTRTRMTGAQARAFSELVHYVLAIVKQAGAQGKRVKVGSLYLRLQEKGAEEILSVRGA